MFDYPNKLDIIFEKLYTFNIKPIMVGGFIRDKILHLDSKDIDIELYGLDSLVILEDILHEFGAINTVGKSFGVCKLFYEELEIDFSLPREDSKIAQGHKGFHILTNKNLDFKTAASRRDFSINAMGYDVVHKKLLDPYNGLQDIQKKLLRAVNIETFSEDPLRVLRGIQLSARLDFTLDPSLLLLFSTLAENNFIDELPKERIYEELKKLFLKSSAPSIGLRLLKKIKLLGYFSFNESYKHVDYFAQNKTEDDTVNMCIFLALLYTKKTYKALSKLTNKQKLLTSLELFLEEQGRFSVNDNSNYTLYKLATQVNLELFLLYIDAYYLGKERKKIDVLRKKAKELHIFNKQLVALVAGKDLISLGLQPSKEFSTILTATYEAQMREEFGTHELAMEWLKKSLL